MLDPTARQIVASCSFLAGLTAEEQEAVMAAGREKRAAPGSYLFHEGSPATVFYIIVSGRVKLTQVTPEGHQVIVAYFGPGDGLGIIVVLSNMAYPVSGEVVEECLALAWDGETIGRMMMQYPHLAINGLRLVARQFNRLSDRYRELATQRVERRVARTLVRLARQAGKPVAEGVLIDMPLSRQDLAEMTGTTLYTVSRILSRWEQEGLVQTGRERVTLARLHGVVEIAEDLPAGQGASIP